MALKPKAKLTALRTARGLSLGALAQELGVHKSHLSRIEAGHYHPTPELAAGIEKFFGPHAINRMELLYDDEPEPAGKKAA
jgi:transcriptional regulator with XRE-family HTH domain